VIFMKSIKKNEKIWLENQSRKESGVEKYIERLY
jgi:hypothetical protein